MCVVICGMSDLIRESALPTAKRRERAFFQSRIASSHVSVYVQHGGNMVQSSRRRSSTLSRLFSSPGPLPINTRGTAPWTEEVGRQLLACPQFVVARGL